MRFGCMGTVEDASRLRELGFDYLEVHAGQTFRPDQEDGAYEPPSSEASALPIEAAACLVPADLPIIGPDRDRKTLREHMRRVAARAAEAGVKRLVFGSGAARRKPDSIAPSVASEHLVDFVNMAGACCQPHGIVLCIEPLHRGETNTLNKLVQARELCDNAAHPAVAVLVDSYHFGRERESDRALLALGDRLGHVHLADPKDRSAPGVSDDAPGTGEANGPAAARTDDDPAPDGGDEADPDAFDFEEFFCLLHKIGYDERMTIEASWRTDMAEEAGRSLEFLRALWRSTAACEED